MLGQRPGRDLFASIKGELIDTQPWPTRAMARRATVEYIAWYNSDRTHSALGYQSPALTCGNIWC